MVKPEKEKKNSAHVASTSNDTSSSKYTGVRKRKWGKYVSEIRLPNCRERIWLGSYDSAEKAARAFDAALFCLRGPSAKFNFPDCPPNIPGGRSMTPSEIQTVSAQYACSVVHRNDSFRSVSESSESSSSEMHVDSPSLSVTEEPVQSGNTGTAVDGSFLDLFSSMGTEYNVTGSYMYPGFDDFTSEFYVPPPIVDEYPEEQYHNGYSHDSLWNF